MAEKRRSVQIIINPAAGKDQPVLATINSVFREAEIDWDIAVTHEEGDARRLAAEAAQRGVDVVAAYGGDGTVMEVASGLIGTGVPLAILPGGTANVMSVELGVPGDLQAACELVCSVESDVVEVDMGEIEPDGCFILRVGIGLEAEMVEGADRELKDKVGQLAYAVSAFQALRESQMATYQLEIDGERIESEGVSCLICNSGSLGGVGFRLSPVINVSDGLLDVIVLRKGELTSLLSVARDVVKGSEPTWKEIQHWQGREISVTATPNQDAQADGELLGQTPVRVRVLPDAVRIIVPRETAERVRTESERRPGVR